MLRVNIFSIINHFGLSLQKHLGAKITVNLALEHYDKLHSNTTLKYSSSLFDGRHIVQEGLTNLSVSSNTVCCVDI